MRLPYQWLKDFVDLPLSVKETANLLTLLGLEVEAQEEVWESPVFEIKVTPQRGDCLSAIGVARELAAALELPLKLPAPQFTESGAPASEAATVEIKALDLCPRYSARLLRKVKIGLSPGWLRQRLEQCGVRPINNVVDVTNLVMMEQGQPLHAFDADLLKPAPGGKIPAIIVRRAAPGEEMVTLDGEKRLLAPEMLVIADGRRAVALAGVMGGSNSEVNDGTSTVLLESAHFAPGSIRRTAKALGMMSEASYRFERRVDPEGTTYALDLAAELIAQLAEAEVAPGVIDVYPQPVELPAISFLAEQANALLGSELSAQQMACYLLRLGIEAKAAGETLQVKPPSWRGDLSLPEDYIEEIARMHGYDKIPSQIPATGSTGGRLSPELALEWEARRILLACGLNEVVAYSLEGPHDIEQAGFPADHPLRTAVLVKNPKVEEYSQLRTTLLPGLLGLLSHNWRRGLREVRAFELGKCYLPVPGEPLADERLRAGLALLAGPRPTGWGKEKVDFYAIKGVVEQLLASLRVEGVSYRPVEHPAFAPGRAAQAVLAGEPLARFGQVREAVQANYDLPKETYLAEVDLQRILQLTRATPVYRPISRFPAVERDLALLVPYQEAAEQVEELLRSRGGELLESLTLFDLYEGKSLPAGHRSLAYALVFRAQGRTLTEEEVERIIADMEKALAEIGVRIRR